MSSHAKSCRTLPRAATGAGLFPVTDASDREILRSALREVGFGFAPPQGAYYVMIDAAPLGWKDDWEFVDFLARKVGVIAVPGSSFYEDGGRTKARLNFAKTEQTLHEAARRLRARDLRAQ